MLIERRLTSSPFLSICIPQYNRTSFLLEVCKSLASQTYQDFEVCISDDCSTDGRADELLAFLDTSPLSYVYKQQTVNQRYDGNIRASMQLAQGKYLFLLGNDDVLKSKDTLEQVSQHLKELGEIGVLFTNYEDFATLEAYPRIHQNGILGTGPEMAVHHFRNFSFVSGVVLNREASERHTTNLWDGSEMYQMYIGCRIIAEGMPLAAYNTITIQKDVQVTGEQVDSYKNLTRQNPAVEKARNLPLNQLIRLVYDSITPYITSKNAPALLEKIARYVYLFPYLFWLLEYRRIQSWWYSFNVAIGMRPSNVLRELPVPWQSRLYITTFYIFITFAGLIFPTSLFHAGLKIFHRFAKRVKL